MSAPLSNRVIVLHDGDVAAGVSLIHAVEAAGDPGQVLIWPLDSAVGPVTATVRRNASAMGVELVGPAVDPQPAADCLLRVGRAAGGHGASRVIWPAHAGVDGDPEVSDIDRAAFIANTALLIERLLEVEGVRAPRIEAPFADLSDRQVAELSIDVGAVPGEVWWGGRSNDEQIRHSERWERAFDATGVAIGTTVRSGRSGG